MGRYESKMLDYLYISDNFQTRVDNQYILIGYLIPSSDKPMTKGCSLIYDSFGIPNCTVEVMSVDGL